MFSKDYAKNYEILNQEKDYKKEIEFIYEWAKHPQKIFDLGCGTAHYWKYYPEGVQIIGVDQSKDMIEMSPYKSKIMHGDITAELKMKPYFDLVTSLFDVIGYMPNNDWWGKIPLKKDGYFIFDIWNKKKVLRDGFNVSIRWVNDLFRVISPIYHDENRVKFQIDLTSTTVCLREIHEMFLYDQEDIEELAGDDFEIVDIEETEKWQTFYKLKKN